MNNFEIVFLLTVLLANSVLNCLIYRCLTQVHNNIKQINRRLMCKAMLKKRSSDEDTGTELTIRIPNKEECLEKFGYRVDLIDDIKHNAYSCEETKMIYQIIREALREADGN